MTATPNEWMTRKEAAKYACTTEKTLAQLAYQHRGPKMFKPSPRKEVYRRSDLDAWLTGTEVAA